MIGLIVLAGIMEANSIGACIVCPGVALLGASIGLPLLLVAAVHGLRAGWLNRKAAVHAIERQYVNRSSLERDDDGTGPQAEPRQQAPATGHDILRFPVGSTSNEPEELSPEIRRDLELAKRVASESLGLGLASLLLLPVAFITAPIAIWRGCTANRTFLQFPRHAHKYGKAMAMAGITLASVALAFAPFLFIAILT